MYVLWAFSNIRNHYVILDESNDLTLLLEDAAVLQKAFVENQAGKKFWPKKAVEDSIEPVSVAV